MTSLLYVDWRQIGFAGSSMIDLMEKVVFMYLAVSRLQRRQVCLCSPAATDSTFLLFSNSPPKVRILKKEKGLRRPDLAGHAADMETLGTDGAAVGFHATAAVAAVPALGIQRRDATVLRVHAVRRKHDRLLAIHTVLDMQSQDVRASHCEAAVVGVLGYESRPVECAAAGKLDKENSHMGGDRLCSGVSFVWFMGYCGAILDFETAGRFIYSSIIVPDTVWLCCYP